MMAPTTAATAPAAVLRSSPLDAGGVVLEEPSTAAASFCCLS